jgi:regulator of protease activity HflC (stomatin/prohibitin superfamily)
LQNLNNTSEPAQPRPPTLVPAMTFLMVGLLLSGAARQPGWPGALLCYVAGTLLVTAAAFLASSIVTLTSRDDLEQVRATKRRSRTSTPAPARVRRSLRVRIARLTELVSNSQLSGESFSILATLILSAMGIAALLKGWRMLEQTPASMQAPAAGVLIVLVFPLLVLERHFASIPAQVLPDSGMLARMCRVPMVALLGLGFASLLRWVDFPGVATLIEHGIALLTALVALELALRSIAGWYSSRATAAERRSHADSTIAGMLRWQRPDFATLSATASRHFGIDLTRSWALGFIRRAAVPSLLVLAASCWLLTGLSALSLSERAVYESFGRPAGVFHPGLHVHLPWPLGVLRPVEFGTVHEIPVVFAAADGTAAEAETQTSTGPTPTNIEGPAPPGADRLWDASHPSEASYLVASASNGRQNFEVINIDLRVLYRIGLSDEAAQEVTYNVASPESIIQAAAGRMLARYFARYTLLDVLGQNREAFIRGFQQELQSRLADLSTGIEIMGIVVEAIHPPPQAAPSYQGVQTAAIRSVVQIAEAKAEAVQNINSAQGNATLMRDEALAAAAERVDQAKAELALFDGDRQAYNTGGKAFLLERRLQHFNKALSGVPFTLVDHRIDRTDAPVLDLRPSSGARDTFVPPSDDR